MTKVIVLCFLLGAVSLGEARSCPEVPMKGFIPSELRKHLQRPGCDIRGIR